MDLATENRIAALLMKEAAELRRQAVKDGVHAYLRQPNVRGRPNARFLTATVLGVQQANRTVEVNEMWRIRQKEQELDDRVKRRHRDESNSDRSYRGKELDDRQKRRKRDESSSDQSYREPELDDKLQRRQRDESRSDRSYRDTEDMWINSNNSHADEGLRDDEVEIFLNSRVKRGRGAVGSRMDETGHFLSQDSRGNELGISYITVRDEWENLHQEKASKLKSFNSSEDDSCDEKCKKTKTSSSRKQKRKHKSKEKSNDKKKKMEERRHKQRK